MKEIILGLWITDIDDIKNISDENLVMTHKMTKNLVKMSNDNISEEYQKRKIKKLDKELKRRGISIIEGRYFINEDK